MKRFISGLMAIAIMITMCPQVFAEPVNMDISDEGIEFLKRFEGFSKKPYLDNGVWRIGYGSEIGDKDYTDGISEQEATELLHEDLRKYILQVNTFLSDNHVEIQQNQLDALVSFTYNLGIGWADPDYKFSSYLINGLENYDDITILDAFVVWCHVGKRVDKGLLNRRIAEAKLLIYGDYKGDKSPDFTYAILNSNGGKVDTDIKCFYKGDSLSTLPIAKKEDYVLSGWYYSSSNKPVKSDDIIKEPIELTAKWFLDVDLPFSDVPEGAWYYGYVGELYAEKVINGMTATTFEPSGNVTYGQALKLILLATGLEPADEIAEGHWAQKYLDLAIDEKMVSDDFCKNLDDVISRANIARLASAAMGLEEPSVKSPFADTKDKNILALYEAGIVEGSVGADGKSYYYPDDSITRAEISTIVWRILSYIEESRHPGQIQFGSHLIDILPGVKKYPYDDSKYYTEDGFRYYEGLETKVGIDVSHHQGDINWDEVKADGVDFAIIRVGGRGYGMDGKMYGDDKFQQNIEGAIAAGIDVGIYYFSQAISVKEAREEAEYVIEHIKDYDITYPVVFDWERIGGKEARTYGLETDLLCKIADTFCTMVQDAGYKPMIYFNSYCGYVKYDLSKLNKYDFWFARYNSEPGFYYDFQMWQYSDQGRVRGIDGRVDLNISFVDYSKK